MLKVKKKERNKDKEIRMKMIKTEIVQKQK